MTRVSILAAALTATLATSAASAADIILAPLGRAVVAMPVDGWGGFYLGLHAGYLGAGGEYTLPGTSEFHLLDPKGFAGGGLAGYGVQYGRAVYGVEADVGVLTGKETLDIGLGPNPADQQIGTEMFWNGHVRGRVGYAFDRVLLFAAGGLAVAGVEHTATDSISASTATWSETRVGWSLGAGAEMKINPRTSLRLEYLYDNYGTTTLSAQTVGAVVFPEREHKLDTHTMRAALNMRF
jgi:opacity protein-like surface antigen